MNSRLKISIPTPVGQAHSSALTVLNERYGFDLLAGSGFVRVSDLVRSPKHPDRPAPVPFSEPTLWRKVKNGSFPKPVKLSERVTAWRVSDVRAWLMAQAAG